MTKRKSSNLARNIDEATVYLYNGRYRIRSKSSLTRKRVLKSPVFAKTRRHAGQLAIASAMVSEIYRNLPPERRKRELYQSMTGYAASLLYKGMEEAEVKEQMMRQF